MSNLKEIVEWENLWADYCRALNRLDVVKALESVAPEDVLRAIRYN